jgi:SNF2 family DNA or RNA helicase
MQTEHVLRLAQNSRRRLGLTGTPISNNLESAFFQMLILDGGRSLGPSKTKFIDEFFTSDKSQGPQSKNVPKQGAVEEVGRRMSRCTYFLKKEDALDLPLKTHTPIYMEMLPDQARYYTQLKNDYLTYIQDSQVSVQQAAARMMKLRQICQGFVLDDMDNPKDFSSAKVDALVDILKGKLYGRKVVVWAVFTHEIDMLCRRMMQEQIGFVRLDGTVKSKKVRDQGLKLWNEHPQVSVFIGQIQMGVGITLHANECTVPCYDCVYLGIDYSFINWTQSQDRIHRIGQKYACSYTYLLTDDGVDRNIYQSLQAKSRTSNAVYKVGKEFYASLVKGDEPNLAAIDAEAA